MYRVVVADDERRIRTSIVSKIEWEALGLQLVEEATNGDELVEVLNREKIDIIITDLNMPGKSGAELLAYLYEKYQDAHVVVISGYDTYSYMRQAIKSQVFDYILKPIQAKSLNETLKRLTCHAEIARRLHKEKKQLTQAKELVKESLFGRFVAEINLTEEELKECLGLETFATEMRYTVAQMHLLNIEKIVREKYANDMNLAIYSAVNVVKEMVGGVASVIRLNSNRIVIVFVEARDEGQLMKCLEGVSRQLNEVLELKGIWGIGKTYSEWQTILQSYKESSTTLDYMNLKGEKIRFYKDVRRGSVALAELEMLKDYVEACIKSGVIAAIKDAISQYYAILMKSQDVSFVLMHHANEDLGQVWNHCLNQWKEAVGVEVEKFIRSLTYKVALDEVVQAWHVFVEDKLVAYVEKINKDTVALIKQYIDDNVEKQMNLDDISVGFGISKQYCIKKFKEKYKVGPYEYILSKKIDKAKLLLVEKDLSIAEIVEKLNFVDASHFSKTFKKYTGSTPKKYCSYYTKNS